MNINAYDPVQEKIDKQRTWVEVKRHRLLSRELPFRPYHIICKRYNTETRDNDYYIILLDDKPENRVYYKTQKDEFGRIKVNLKSIWSESTLKYITKNENIAVFLEEHTDDGDIYKLDI